MSQRLLERSRRRATIDGAERELDVLRGTPAPGLELPGPAIVELPESTLLVAPAWSARCDAHGTLHLVREEGR